MHRACTIVVETLEVLAQAAVAGATTKDLDTISRERIVKAGEAGLPRLPRLSGDALHLRERRGRPRHPVREAQAQGRRPREPRPRLHRGRLLRGRRAHGRRGPGERRGPAPHEGHRAVAAGRDRAVPPRARAWGTSAPARAGSGRRATGTPSSGSSWVTGSGPACTRTRRCRTTGHPARRERLVPGMCLAIEPMVNVGRPEVRVLDDGGRR